MGPFCTRHGSGRPLPGFGRAAYSHAVAGFEHDGMVLAFDDSGETDLPAVALRRTLTPP